MQQWTVLDGLPPAERDELLRAGRRRYPDRVPLYRLGDPADALFLLVEGRVAIRVATPDGEEAILTVLGTGAVFGAEAALPTGAAVRRASVTALGACVTVVLRRAQIERLRAVGPHVDRFLLGVLGDDLGRLSTHLLEMLFVAAPIRVLRRLVALAGELDGAPVRITQQELALMAGTTRPTVNEALREAQRAGAIRLGRARIEVLDDALLRRCAK